MILKHKINNNINENLNKSQILPFDNESIFESSFDDNADEENSE